MPAERLRLRDIRNTSTFRLTLLLGAAAMVGVVAMIGLIYSLSARELNARTDHILRDQASRIVASSDEALPDAVRAAIARGTPGLNYYGLIAADGTPIAGDLRAVPDILPNRMHEIAAAPGRHGPIRLLAIRTRARETILVGRDVTPIADLRRRVTDVLVTSGVITAVLLVLAGIALSIAPLRRVEALRRSALEIAAGHLGTRMPIMGRGDELDLFAGTVNTMVEEVGRVVSEVKAVTDAVAHDLRTPLTRVRSQLYRATREPGADPALVARIDLAIADLDSVLDRFAALLRISELEAGSRKAGFGPFSLHALIGAVVELYEPLAEDRTIALSFTGPSGATVFGDDKLLFEAIGNLVDNAIKFAPIGGRVAISLAQETGRTIIEIRDNGPGIVADRRKSVLRRFDRGDTSHGVDGTGLGLSVVSAILHLHQFSLEFADAQPGLIARIVAPTA